MSAYQMGYLAGVVFCFVVVFLCIFIAVKLKRRNGGVKEEFDERQLLERGNAYKYGFFAFLIECGLYIFVYAGEFDSFLMIEPGVAAALAFFIPLTVFAFYSITHDAFMAYNANGRRSYIIYILVFVANAVSAIINISSGHIFAEGHLSVGIVNLLLAVLFGAILIALFIRSRMDKE